MYPVRYEADYVEPQNRWITFFRLILVIPWYLLGSIYAIGAFIVAFLAWFAIVFTGRYPEGLYKFNAGFLRFIARAYGVHLPADRPLAAVRLRAGARLPDPGRDRPAAASSTTAGRPASG